MRVTNALIQKFVSTSSSGIKEVLFDAAKKISSGRVIDTPSEDPIRAAKIVRMDRLIKKMDTIDKSYQRVRSDLAAAEQGLSHASSSLTEIKSMAIAMATDTVSDTDRDATAQTIQGFLDQLVNTANRQQEDGRHLFSGIAEGQAPYTLVGAFPNTTITYTGSTAGREVEVAPGVKVDATVTGAQSFGANGEVFQTVADLITALDANNDAGIEASLNALDDQMETVVVNLASVGTRIRALDETNTITEDLKIQYMLAKADVEEVDVTAEITRYTTAETSLQAVVEVSRRLMSNSLASFLR
ncbi:MAG: hypothetical protein VX938_06075 [Myxococcota bacterium]|nr:hypothetical protein [Myxococcota bacterium]